MADSLRRAPLIVTGMHRSGTSLTAAMLAACNLDVGPRLLAPDEANRGGYFEDIEFVALHGRMLTAATLAGDGGHRDWGWTESGVLDRSRLAEFRDDATQLYERRASVGTIWGWKDPRTTLTLDFWDEISGQEARYLLLYRFPWEVADSMQRLGAPVFLERPDYAYRIWHFYNEALLDFHRRHPRRSVLVSVNALVGDPTRLRSLLAERFDLSLSRSGAFPAVQSDRFSYLGPSDPLIDLVAATRPECTALLARLDAAADLSGNGMWSAAPPSGRRLDGRAEGTIDLSIVIPCHDDGEFLIEAVASAERCAPPATELVIVNDGSTDGRTLAILAVLRGAGFHVVDQEKSGLAAARNRGVRESRGRFLLPLDADNRLRAGFPQAGIGVLDREPDVGVVYGGRMEFGLRSCTVEVAEFDVDRLLRANFIDACAVLRREVWEQCGGYDGAMPFMGWEDWDLWIGAAERGWRFHRLAGLTFDYRVRPDSMATNLGSAEKGEPLRIYLFDKHHELYRRRLPSMLTAQYEAAEERVSSAQAAALEQLGAMLERLTLDAEALRAERSALAAELDGLRAERSALAAEIDGLRAETSRSREERDLLYTELASWRSRVAFMEETTAWRAREAARSFRSRLGRWVGRS